MNDGGNLHLDFFLKDCSGVPKFTFEYEDREAIQLRHKNRTSEYFSSMRKIVQRWERSIILGGDYIK